MLFQEISAKLAKTVSSVTSRISKLSILDIVRTEEYALNPTKTHEGST